MIDMSARAVTHRLRHAAEHVGLRADLRMRCKLDMSATAVTLRLQKVEALRRLCAALVRVGEANGLGRRRRRTS